MQWRRNGASPSRSPTAPRDGVVGPARDQGREAARRWLCDELGLPLRLNYVRAAVAKGEIPSVKKGEVHYFSTRGLFEGALKFAQVAS
jgi:hypothetical protein